MQKLKLVKSVEKINPVLAVFCLSLLLSLIAQHGTALNRDGMLYVTTAEAFLQGGYAAAHAQFAWPFLSIAMAITSKITGLEPQLAGYVLNAFFMAGACALLVDCVRRQQPESVWWVGLALLAMPGINEYRNELLREYGCWFFIMLSFWGALRWSEQPRWISGFGILGALGAAALFRPEAVALYPALVAWQWFDAPRDERRKRLLMLGCLPALAGAILLILFFTGHLSSGNRLASDLGRLSFERFDAKAKIMSTAFIEYARHNSGEILFFGSLALIPIKLVQKMGIFVIPAIALFARQEFRQALMRYRLFATGVVFSLLVLAIFVVDLQFLAGRYVGLTLIFFTPFVGYALWSMLEEHRKWRPAVVVVLCLIMLTNVVSTSSSKIHHQEAGQWLRENAKESSAIYINSGRTAFHAGWRNAQIAKRNDRPAVEQALEGKTYSLYVLEISHKDASFDDWLSKKPLKVIKRFQSGNGDAVVVASPSLP